MTKEEIQDKREKAAKILEKRSMTKEEIMSITGQKSLEGFKKYVEKTRGEGKKPYFDEDIDGYIIPKTFSQRERISNRLKNRSLGFARSVKKIGVYGPGILKGDTFMQELESILQQNTIHQAM